MGYEAANKMMKKAEKLAAKAARADARYSKLFDREDALAAKIEALKLEQARLRHKRGKAGEAAYEANEAHRVALNEALAERDEAALDDFNYVGSRHHY